MEYDSKGTIVSVKILMPYIADQTGGSIHHQNKENSTPQAVLLGMHWQHGQDTTVDGYAWGDNRF